MDYVLGLSSFVFSAFCSMKGGCGSWRGCYSGEEQVHFIFLDQLFFHFFSLSSLLTFPPLSHPYTHIKVFMVSHTSSGGGGAIQSVQKAPKKTRLSWTDSCVEGWAGSCFPYQERTTSVIGRITEYFFNRLLRFGIKQYHGCTRFRGKECKWSRCWKEVFIKAKTETS